MDTASFASVTGVISGNISHISHHFTIKSKDGNSINVVKRTGLFASSARHDAGSKEVVDPNDLIAHPNYLATLNQIVNERNRIINYWKGDQKEIPQINDPL